MLLELKDVSRAYTTDGGLLLRVLDRISLAVAAGESVAVVGPSGSGKSTLLNIIGALDRPTEGAVLLDGRDLAQLDDDAQAAVRSRDIGFVFQLHHLLPQCTALENVLVPTLSGAAAPAAEDPVGRARRLLERVGLGGRERELPGRLSVGERQRVAVARALINRPRLLLADEPTGSLDRATAGKLAELLVEVNREEGIALIVVTHAPALAETMSRCYILRDGILLDAKHGV